MAGAMTRAGRGIRRLLGRETAAPAVNPPAGDAPAPQRGEPLRRIDAEAARGAHKHNPHTVWSARAYAANEADRTLACHRIWQRQPELHINPKFRLAREDAVFASGSCFAREVEDALAEAGFAVPSRCDELFASGPLAQEAAAAAGARPRSYLNRYNSMSMLDEYRHLLGLAPEIEAGLLCYPLDRGTAADLHYSQSLKQATQEVSLARRRCVREYLGPLARRCRVHVLTLGMAECWYDERAGRYLNNTPGPRVLAAYGDRLAVHLTRFEQHRNALEELHRMLAGVHGDDFRIVITVSPVPLERTFLDQDVVVTNSYSKSMLRAVAQDFATAHANVDYFPSYELVGYAEPGTAWAWDHRHVNPDLVRHIMALFRSHYIEGAEPASAPPSG